MKGASTAIVGIRSRFGAEGGMDSPWREAEAEGVAGAGGAGAGAPGTPGPGTAGASTAGVVNGLLSSETPREL